jgi:hypothetical protein
MADSKKRVRAADDGFDAVFDNSLPSDDESAASDEIDITAALTGRKRQKVALAAPDYGSEDEAAYDDDDDGLADLIRTSIAKRNAKEGTEVLKNVKGGKKKLAKGEVGGGSFQSMSALHYYYLKATFPTLSAKACSLGFFEASRYRVSALLLRSNVFQYPSCCLLLPGTSSEWLGRAPERVLLLFFP